MNKNRTWVLVGVLAGVVAAGIGVIAVPAFGARQFLDEWAGLISVIGFAALGLLLGWSRWRHGGWAEVRSVWWLFAPLGLYVALRIASLMGVGITDLLGL